MAERVAPDYLDAWIDGPATEFPFHIWADGSTWRIREGEDFNCPPAAFMAAANMHAALMELKVVAVRVPQEEGRDAIIIFRFEKPEDDD
ncbi:hypothetical protein [Streptomyces sp. CoT10]|uniref:hypothetical protein n=1 Tax=Streptomyces sp. CoT10 TaxID=2875762 RepID=UPI001CD2590F|nr:hypothetical protein [Streptomyces sp. CoT10]